MTGDDEIIELLNEILTGELTAINQYFVDAKMFKNWGYERLGKRFRDESIDEMHDADKLIERILYLDGLPNLQRLGTVRVGETPVEKLQLALELEREAIDRLNRGIARAVELGDNVRSYHRGIGVVVHSLTRIGSDVHLFLATEERPLTVGRGTVIGANSVLTTASERTRSSA